MSDGGEDSPPQRPRRKIKKIIVASSASASDSDDSGPTTSTRKKRLRVLSDDDGESSSSSLDLGSRRKRMLPQLRDSDGDSDTSGWATDHSDAPKETHTTTELPTSQIIKPLSGFASDSSEGNSEKCSICLMRFTDQQVGTPQSCEHVFCLDCITEWSRNVNTCPVDRMTFDSIVVRACVGGRVLSTQPVQVMERAPSMELLVVEEPTACEICGAMSGEDTMLLCDGCDLGFHMECLTPPMTQVPLNQWLCPSCDDRFDVFDFDNMSDENFAEWTRSLRTSRGTQSGSPSPAPPTPYAAGPSTNVAGPSYSAGPSSHAAGPSTSARVAGSLNLELPSTSRGRARSTRVSSARRRDTSVRRTHRRKYKRRSTRTVIIEYELEGNGKYPVTERVKRRVKKRKTKKRQPRTAARRTQVRESVRAKLATLRAERGAAAAPRAAGAGSALAARRSRAGVPALSLFGSARDLDYFSDDERGAGPGAGAAVAVRPSPASFAAYRQARRKMVAVPSPPRAPSASDVLSSILKSQTLLHSKRSIVSVTVDGDVDIKIEPRRRRPTSAREGRSPSAREGQPSSAREERRDLSQGADSAARKAPSYPGQPRNGGGWGGGYRYPRDQAPGGYGRGDRDDAYGGGGARGRGWGPPHRAGDGDAFDGYDDRRPHQYSQNDDALFDRNRRRPSENDRGPGEHNGRRGDERGRPGEGPAWRPYGARPGAPPPRHSYGALEDPLDMRVGHAPPPAAGASVPDEVPAPVPSYGPLPEPPAFRFVGAPGAVEDGDPDRIVDTEKYDPTEPTDDDEGGAPPPPAPVLAAFPGVASLASVGSLLAGLDTGAVAAGVLDSAVRQALQEHRGLLGSPARPDSSDGASDGDCPNFAIYSATSVHIASDASAGARAEPAPAPAPAPEDGFEDLVQGDGDASPTLSDEPTLPPAPASAPVPACAPALLAEAPAPSPAPSLPPSEYEASAKRKSEEYNEKVSKRCPITTNTRNPIKIKLNTPSLIRRQVSLYDEEDVETTETAAEPEATAELEVAAEPEATVDPEEDAEAENRESRKAEIPCASRDGAAKSDSPPPFAASESAEDSERSPGPDANGDPDSEGSSERGGTPSVAGAAEPRSPRVAAASEKMTESISETEDERSYTPCLDENRERDRGIEGLDTEMISEDEGNEMFSDERSASPAAGPPAAAVAAGPPAPADARKRKKREAKREGRERKGKAKRAEVAFKKAGKAAKERNYRERDKEERAESRSRRGSADSERARRRKDKRKDLERYDVRTLVSERRRRTKDAFGRDVSPRASPSASPARSATPPRAEAAPRAASPRRRRRRSASRPKRAEARRRRSGSRARKRRRSASGSPKPKPKKKKRARSERPRSRSRSPRRKSPKRKRVRRRSDSRRSPAAVAEPAPAWSPAPESRPASPRTPPPQPEPAPEPDDTRRVRKRRDRSKHRRTDGPGPSKEVFTSGDNILVSVSFKDRERAEAQGRRERRRERRRRRRRAAAADDSGPKPVAIIDLERSPFRELTPSPKNVIVLSDDEQREAPPPAPAPEVAGPKTPPSPALAAPPPAAAADEPRGPNTPPEPPDSPDAYDPYEPTRSASASPSPAPAASPARTPMTLEAAQKTNMSADEVLDRRPLSPIEKVMALLQSTRDEAPEPPPAAASPPAAPAPAPAPRVVLPSPTRAAPPKLFLAKPSPIKSDPIKPMQQATKISRLPLPRGGGGDSPYSPGSSDFGDLFEPPAAPPGARRDSFEALFDKPVRGKKRSGAAKVPVKLNKKKGKTQVDVKIDDDNLKILDDLPSSAVEMQVKSKFLKKLNRQERVVEEVKLVLKPHYNKKHVSKEEYKHILRRAVPKICHNKNGEINPTKIQALVEAYVKKFRKKRKLGLA